MASHILETSKHAFGDWAVVIHTACLIRAESIDVEVVTEFLLRSPCLECGAIFWERRRCVGIQTVLLSVERDLVRNQILLSQVSKGSIAIVVSIARLLQTFARLHLLREVAKLQD